MTWLRQHKLAIGLGLVLIALLIWGPTVYANLSTRSERYDLAKSDIKQVPKEHVGLVLGAGLLPGGKPTPYLGERVTTAAALYKAGRVDVLLMSGDNTSQDHNEPMVMKKLAIASGVPAGKVYLDYAGLNTYDSCYRAQAIFKVRQATIISQGYHLPRAVMTCQHLGIRTIGVAAQHTSRDYTYNYIAREWVSTDKVSLQLLFKPHPTALGQAEPIK